MAQLAVVLVKLVRPIIPARPSHLDEPRPRAPRRRVRALITALVVVLPAITAVAPASAAGSTAPGQLYAFGENNDGQLGNAANNGSTSANPTPVQLSVPAATGQLVQVATAKDHSLLLTSSGQVFSFGDNYYGQLGNATNANNSAVSANPDPTPVTLPGPAAQVAAGDQLSLVLLSNGQLYAFGANAEGQLGNNNNDASIANPTPTLVNLPGGATVAQIAAGDDFSLALTTGGQLYAFGDNEYGQLGNGTNNATTAANPTPSLVALPAGRITQIAAGFDYSLVLSSTGQVFAFGDNEYGQLGSPDNSGTTTANPSATQVSIPASSGPVVQIAAGGYQSLVLTSSGQVYAFGDNDYGELASAANNGTTTANSGAALVKLPAGAGRPHMSPPASTTAWCSPPPVSSTLSAITSSARWGPPLTAVCPAPTPSPNLSASLPVPPWTPFSAGRAPTRRSPSSPTLPLPWARSAKAGCTRHTRPRCEPAVALCRTSGRRPAFLRACRSGRPAGKSRANPRLKGPSSPP